MVAALKLRSPGSEDAAPDCPAWLAAMPELPDAGCALHVRGPNPRVEEFPFSSERKRMTTVHDLSPHAAAVAGAPYTAFMKGAPEVVLARCDRVLSGGEVRPLTEADRAAVLAAAEGMAGRALRVLALSMLPLEGDANSAPLTEEDAESGHVLLGLAGMMDPPRDEAKDAVATCRRVGIRPVMITGDHRLTAEAVAHEIGIHREGDVVLTGDGLAALDDDTFAGMVDKVSVYARVSPMDKLRIVKAWKARGDVVAMTGDGVNDAPALKQADIGVAMGIAGTEVAREAADMVLTDDNFASIVKAIELGRWIYDNIKKYLTFLLRCNITEVAVIGGMVLLLGPDYLPLLPAAILYINLATDGLPALALGVAPPDPDIMERPPRDPRESVFTRDVTTFVLLAVCIEIPLFFGLFLYDLSDIGTARTEMFFLFIVIEMIIALNFRSMRFSIMQAPPHGWLLLAIVWEVVLIVLLMQFAPVRDAFGIHMPDGRMLGIRQDIDRPPRQRGGLTAHAERVGPQPVHPHGVAVPFLAEAGRQERFLHHHGLAEQRPRHHRPGQHGPRGETQGDARQDAQNPPGVDGVAADRVQAAGNQAAVHAPRLQRAPGVAHGQDAQQQGARADKRPAPVGQHLHAERARQGQGKPRPAQLHQQGGHHDARPRAPQRKVFRPHPARALVLVRGDHAGDGRAFARRGPVCHICQIWGTGGTCRFPPVRQGGGVARPAKGAGLPVVGLVGPEKRGILVRQSKMILLHGGTSMRKSFPRLHHSRTGRHQGSPRRPRRAASAAMEASRPVRHAVEMRAGCSLADCDIHGNRQPVFLTARSGCIFSRVASRNHDQEST